MDGSKNESSNPAKNDSSLTDLSAEWFRSSEGTPVSAEAKEVVRGLFDFDPSTLKGRDKLMYSFYASGVGGFVDNLRELGQDVKGSVGQALEKLRQQREESAQYKQLKKDIEKFGN